MRAQLFAIASFLTRQAKCDTIMAKEHKKIQLDYFGKKGIKNPIETNLKRITKTFDWRLIRE